MKSADTTQYRYSEAMNGVRLNISRAIGIPMTVSWMSQANPIQMADAHQPDDHEPQTTDQPGDLRASLLTDDGPPKLVLTNIPRASCAGAASGSTAID